MIDGKFTDENIIGLMAAFEEGRYKDVQSMVTDNADAPTIFEYVLAITQVTRFRSGRARCSTT